MEYVCLDLEGVLVPEIWAEVAKFTGEEKFNLTLRARSYLILKFWVRLKISGVTLTHSLGFSRIFNQSKNIFLMSKTNNA